MVESDELADGNNREKPRDTRLPIATILCPGEIDGRTRIQKYLFLLQERVGFQIYTFEAHDYGPFSRNVYYDLDELVETGFVDEDKRLDDCGRIHYYYSATDEARELVRSAEDRTVEERICTESAIIRNKHDEKNLKELIQYIYTEYPRMARNSVI